MKTFQIWTECEPSSRPSRCKEKDYRGGKLSKPLGLGVLQGNDRKNEAMLWPITTNHWLYGWGDLKQYFQPSPITEQWGSKSPLQWPHLLFSLNILTSSLKEPLIPIQWTGRSRPCSLPCGLWISQVWPSPRSPFPLQREGASGFSGPPQSQPSPPFLWTCRTISQIGKLRFINQESPRGLSDYNGQPFSSHFVASYTGVESVSCQ